MSRPGRKIVSKGILVIQNITRHDAGEENYLCWEMFTTNMVVSNISNCIFIDNNYNFLLNIF